MVKLEEIYALRSDEKQVTDLLARVEKRDPKNVQGYLAGAYNCMGDLYQSSLKFEEAVSYFQKALTVCKKPADIAHAHFNIAVCYINLDPPRYKEAAAEFKAVTLLPDAPADLKKDAQDAVKQLKANNIQ